MRHIILLSLIFSFSFGNLSAEQGMWIPSLLKQLNESEMQNMGLKLSAEQIYSINNSSLKDAVVHFGGGCTGEIVSDKGLIFTNHHCGYSFVTKFSTVENNYLTNGFWAESLTNEIACVGLEVSIISSITDVTKEILDSLSPDISEEERSIFVSKSIKSLEEKYKKETGLHAEIKPFYFGNEYYLFLKKVYKDIRLVGAPPSSIGKFGGDTDNWMWPRHTGDFAVFRIYADSNNNAAEYNINNIPFTPAHHFPISLESKKENDFTMVYGFPGTTEQYLSSEAVGNVMTTLNPARIEVREQSLKALKEYMSQGEQNHLDYASRYARISNYHKKWIGESNGLKKLNAIATKKRLEISLASEYPEAEKVIARINALENEKKNYDLARAYFVELYYYVPQFIRVTNKQFQKIDQQKMLSKDKEIFADFETILEKIWKYYFTPKVNKALEKNIFKSTLSLYVSNVSEKLMSKEFSALAKLSEVELNNYVEDLFSNSYLLNKKKFDKMRKSKKTAKKIDKILEDKAYILSTSLMNFYIDSLRPKLGEIKGEIASLNREYIQLLKKFQTDRNFYPDANSTLRLSYGKIEGFVDHKGLELKPFTTLGSLMKKEDPNSDEFNVPSKLKELYESKDYGSYANDKGELPVCFLASNHTTGGNSGSPVINANGELIGINFDRSWESTMSDIMYDPDKCRNIAVDMNYVLFIIDKYAGASRLIEELDIVKEVN